MVDGSIKCMSFFSTVFHNNILRSTAVVAWNLTFNFICSAVGYNTLVDKIQSYAAFRHSK